MSLEDNIGKCAVCPNTNHLVWVTREVAYCSPCLARKREREGYRPLIEVHYEELTKEVE